MDESTPYVLPEMSFGWSDGTAGAYFPNVPLSTSPAPVDAAGGAAGQYSQNIMDVFKLGLGAYVTTQQIDAQTKRYEATNGGVYQQGQPALLYQNAAGQRANMGLLLVGGLILFLLVRD